MEHSPDNLTIVRTETFRGRPHIRWSDGTLLPVVSGGDGTGDAGGAGGGAGGSGSGSGAGAAGGGGAGGGAGDQGGAGGAGGGSGASERTFTQEDLNRRAAAEKEQGRRAGETALLESLGITDTAEAKRIIDAHREAERQRMTAEQQAAADAEKARRDAENDRELAKADRVAAAVERALIRGGLVLPDKDEEADKVLARAIRLVDVSDPDPEKVRAAVAELKTDMPSLFAAGEGNEGEAGAGGNGNGNGNAAGGSGNPGGRSRQQQGNVTAMEAGRQRARAEQEAAAKQGSPFDRMPPIGARK